jgi:A/G-specific adenine glycosylase
MLQQTQASRVEPAFVAFCERFPTVEALAAASRADVLRAWAGLGYNRRAVRLHGAAREIVERHGGRVPPSLDVLRTLPGVGPYTASAIASIAFGAPVVAVDTNVRRIVARVAFGAEPDEVPAGAPRGAPPGGGG